MRKPSFKYFHEFKEMFDRVNKKNNMKQQLIPYFISSHPACQLEDMANLAAETKNMGFQLEQVQDFTPTPMTVATIIYYSGYHPYTLKQVDTPKTKEEKRDQHKFFFWYKRENHQWIKSVLGKAGRADLVNELLGEAKEMVQNFDQISLKKVVSLALPTKNREKISIEKAKRTIEGESKRSVYIGLKGLALVCFGNTNSFEMCHYRKHTCLIPSVRNNLHINWEPIVHSNRNGSCWQTCDVAHDG